MKILVCNDDGVLAPGIKILANELAKKYNVSVIAPDGNRSCYAHSMTLPGRLILKKIDAKTYFEDDKNVQFVYSLSGTPVDCIKFAKVKFNRVTDDIVVAGINSQHNIGTDIMYSGTVAIGCEASFYGAISFCFSCMNNEEKHLKLFSDYAIKIIEKLTPLSKKGDVWNINFPNIEKSDIKGMVITKLGKQIYSDAYVEDGDGYILTGKPINHNENDGDCDIEWHKKGYITITPITFDRTDYLRIKEVKNLCEKL